MSLLCLFRTTFDDKISETRIGKDGNLNRPLEDSDVYRSVRGKSCQGQVSRLYHGSIDGIFLKVHYSHTSVRIPDDYSSLR